MQITKQMKLKYKNYTNTIKKYNLTEKTVNFQSKIKLLVLLKFCRKSLIK